MFSRLQSFKTTDLQLIVSRCFIKRLNDIFQSLKRKVSFVDNQESSTEKLLKFSERSHDAVTGIQYYERYGFNQLLI